MKRTLLLTIILLLLCSPAWAATYYVTQSGAGGDTGADCANAKSLAWFNANAVAGDTAILCDGAYTTGVNPTNEGTSGNLITYEADSGATPVMTVTGDGANLAFKDYIILDGITFGNCTSEWIYLEGSDYCVIKNCIFSGTSGAYAGIRFDEGAINTYCQVLDNTFADALNNNPYDHIMANRIQNCLFEGNTFNKVGHQNLDIGWGDSQYNVIKNNTFQNEFHTGLSIQRNSIIESNRFLDCGEDYLNDPTPASNRRSNPGIQGNSSDNIIRYNEFDQCGGGLILSTYPASPTADDSRVYNNTFNSCVRNHSTSPNSGYDVSGNIFKNNIYTNAFDYAAENGYNIFFIRGDGTNRWYNNLAYGGTNEYLYDSLYTSFEDLISDKSTQFPSGNIEAAPVFTDEPNRDFTLRSTSNAIDAGTYLTLVNDVDGGNGTSLVVDDASYFYTTSSPWNTPGNVMLNDTIYVKSGTPFTITITAINYTTNTLTLASSQTWDDNSEVYWCPDGVCFSGSAPDIGANEFEGETSELRAHWEFEDDPGLLVDSSETGTYTLTNNNTVVNAAGKVGEAAVFDGVDQSLSRTGMAGDFGWNSTNQATITFWAYIDDLPAVSNISDAFSKGTHVTPDYDISLYVDEDGSPFACIGHVDSPYYECEEYTSGDFVAGRWYFVGFAINDSGATVEGLADQEMRIRIWDDTNSEFLGTPGGGEETPSVTAHWLPGRGGDIFVGSYGTANYWDGMIDSFRFYNKVLSSADIDALRTSATTISAFFHCDVSKVQIDVETTYNAGDTCYLCIQSSGGNMFFVDGPLNNLQIGTDMSYPDKEEWEYLTGIGTNIVQFHRLIQIGDSELNLVAEGTAEDTGLIHGATKLTDVGGTEITYTLPQADPAGGNIIISAPSSSASPLTVGTTGSIAKISDREILDDDFFKYLTPVTDDVDLTGFDGVIISGIGRTQVNIGTLDFGTNCHARCVNFSGAVTGAGANGNTYHPICQRRSDRMGMNF